jgi:hypothetical protein
LSEVSTGQRFDVERFFGNAALGAAMVAAGGVLMAGGRAISRRVGRAPVQAGVQGGVQAGEAGALAPGRLAGEVAPPSGPTVVYRGGARTPANLTPRPGVDVEGLSTFKSLEQAARPGGKAQVIDVDRLKPGGLSAVPDAPSGHVSLRPGAELTPEVQQAIRDWAATRLGALADPSAPMHPYTRTIWDAIIDEVKRPPQ